MQRYLGWHRKGFLLLQSDFAGLLVTFRIAAIIAIAVENSSSMRLRSTLNGRNNISEANYE